MEFLVENMDWLEEKLKPLVEGTSLWLSMTKLRNCALTCFALSCLNCMVHQRGESWHD